MWQAPARGVRRCVRSGFPGGRTYGKLVIPRVGVARRRRALPPPTMEAFLSPPPPAIWLWNPCEIGPQNMQTLFYFQISLAAASQSISMRSSGRPPSARDRDSSSSSVLIPLSRPCFQRVRPTFQGSPALSHCAFPFSLRSYYTYIHSFATLTPRF